MLGVRSWQRIWDFAQVSRGRQETGSAREAFLRRCLSPRAMQVIDAVAETILQDAEGPPPPARMAWFSEELNDVFAHATGVPAIGMRLMPWVFEFSPLYLFRHLRLFTQLTPQERLGCLEAIEHSRIEQLSALLHLCKTLICVVYYEHPETLMEVGFDGLSMFGERPDAPLTHIDGVRVAGVGRATTAEHRGQA